MAGCSADGGGPESDSCTAGCAIRGAHALSGSGSPWFLLPMVLLSCAFSDDGGTVSGATVDGKTVDGFSDDGAAVSGTSSGRPACGSSISPAQHATSASDGNSR